MTEQAKLKPCPFCGGEPNLQDAGFGDPEWVYYVCGSCRASSDACGRYEQAIAAWNRRANSAEGLAKALENSVKANELLQRELVAAGGDTMPTMDLVIEQAHVALKLYREGKS